MDLKKKIGPLPVWAWGLILGVVGYFAYERYSASSSSSSGTASTTGILDPNAVDPNTGLTYGEEEQAALNNNAEAASGGGTGGGVSGPTDSGLGSTVTPTNEFGDFLTFLGEWNQFASALGWTAPGSGGAGSGTTSPPPVQGSNPPTAGAAANTNSLIYTHPGGPFYDWYVKTFGSAPPSSISATNGRYLAWKAGIPAATAKTIPVNSQAGQAGTAVLNNSSSLGKAATITTHPGGTFYTWYQKTFGSPPPAQLSSTNARYVAWTKGVPAAQAKKIPA